MGKIPDARKIPGTKIWIKKSRKMNKITHSHRNFTVEHEMAMKKIISEGHAAKSVFYERMFF